jgi:hypothetical protein
MTVVAITSASVGTKLATGADTHLVGLTITQPSSTADLLTPLTLVDAAGAPTAPVGFFRTLYSAPLLALSFLFGVKPTGPSMAPGLTPPAWPQSLFSALNIPFTNGVYVQSCPAGVTFSLTTG